MRLDIVMPAHNEEDRIDRTLRAYRAACPDDGVRFLEGQAYAMLLSVAADDRSRFDRVWGWTRAHLQRSDGLLSWRWADGHVVQDEPAADADLDAARALALAADRVRRALVPRREPLADPCDRARRDHVRGRPARVGWRGAGRAARQS